MHRHSCILAMPVAPLPDAMPVYLPFWSAQSIQDLVNAAGIAMGHNLHALAYTLYQQLTALRATLINRTPEQKHSEQAGAH